MTKKELICFFKGHCDDDTNPELPYGYCPRCEKDYNEWEQPLLQRWYSFRYKVIWWCREHIYWKCQECNKAKSILGKDVNNHDECLPF